MLFLVDLAIFLYQLLLTVSKNLSIAGMVSDPDFFCIPRVTFEVFAAINVQRFVNIHKP
jgi:hypothetical protein